MEKQDVNQKLPRDTVLLLWVLAGAGLYWISRIESPSFNGYLLFHGIVEVFSIVVACAIFMIAWNSRRLLDNHYLLFMGIAFLFVSVFDFVHTLTYKGMVVFADRTNNSTIQLWIAARYMESLSFLIAPFFIKRKVRPNPTFSIFAVISGLLLLSIFYWKIFPDCFVEGVGLTGFKKTSEFVISALILAAIALLVRYRHSFDREILRFLIVGLAVKIFSEISFTLYLDLYGIPNLIGHYFKIVSFYFFYRAIIQIGLQKPYDLLFRSLKQSEARYRHIIEDQTELICRFSEQGRLTFVNRAFGRFFNQEEGTLLGRGVDALFLENDQELLRKQCGSCTLQNPVAISELRVTAPGRETRWLQWTCRAIHNPRGDLLEFQAVGKEITLRKQAEKLQQLSAEILSLLNRSPALPDTVAGILGAIKREMGLEAVGIRLRSGEDFPYFIQNGFPNDFLLTENTLIARTRNGDICRDPDGKAGLECTCGLVLAGRTDPAQALFTPGGSAWTNDSSALLNLSADQDPRLNPRNRCIHDGYCSVALIPIRTNREIVGLLQLNDRQKDRFTLELIRFFEGISASIGVALMRKQAEEALQKAHAELEKRVEERTKELSQSNRLLKQSEAELRRLSAKLLRAQESERKLVALELHDGIGQGMSAVKFGVENGLQKMEKGDQAGAGEALKPLILMIQQTMEDVRRMARNLWPSILDDLGILAALSWFTREYEKIYAPITVERRIELEEKDVPNDLKIILFRIIQEALNNIAKHSQARHVYLALEKTDEILLTIRDQGRGFEVEKILSGDSSGRGLGLAGMKERAELSGGRFTIHSRPGEGTVIRVAWMV